MEYKAEKKKLMKQIEAQRENLHALLENSDNTNSEQALVESQKLDRLLTEYEKIKDK